MRRSTTDPSTKAKGNSASSSRPVVSIIIPTRNEAATIERLIHAVRRQQAGNVEIEVVVVDDGSADDTVDRARQAGARVVQLEAQGSGGNPAAARNRGAEVATGDPLVFLDADCMPTATWLRAFLDAHAAGEVVVGGALDLPPGLPASARCDYYCGWYLIHSRRPRGYVPHHPPPNLSVRRDVFFDTSRFTEHQPFSFTNEERIWQGEVRRAGHQILFEPDACAFHYNRPGYANLLRRNYRWAYTALESKSTTGAARLAWLYRSPRLLIAASVPLAFAQTAYIIGCWLRVGVVEPLLMAPFVLASRFAYVAGMTVGGLRWLRQGRQSGTLREAPRWQ